MIDVGQLEFFTDGSVHVNDELPTPHVIVMQSTGLKDEEGKEIYESDVVVQEDIGDCKVVAWDKNAGRWMPVMGGGKCECCMGWHESLPWKVVGDVYRNPELLKP